MKLDLPFEHLLFQITWLRDLINMCLKLSYVLKMPVLKSVEHHYFGEILVYVKLRYVAHRSGRTKPSNSYCFVCLIVVEQETKNALTLLETPTIKIAVILNGRRFIYCSCVVLIMKIIHSQSATLQRRCAETARSVIVNRYIGVNKRTHVYLSSEIH